MSGWNFDHAGRFGSDDDARRHAERNGIDPCDVRTRGYGAQTKLENRRSASEARSSPRRLEVKGGEGPA